MSIRNLFTCHTHITCVQIRSEFCVNNNTRAEAMWQKIESLHSISASKLPARSKIEWDAISEQTAVHSVVDQIISIALYF